VTTLINDAHREFAAMAPSMLKKKMVEMVFLPWLSAFTGRVVRAAKEEERQAILVSLPSPAEVPDADPAWLQGHKDALENVRTAILQRCENEP